MSTRVWLRTLMMVALACASFCLFAGTARADDKPSTCSGPAECCPPELTEESKDKIANVEIGVVLVGIYEINEKASTWSADFYLTENWVPLPGFAPATEIYNEVNRSGEQFDRTTLVNGHCHRERRIRSTLHTSYNLRTFPFDKQKLDIVFSDAVFPTSRVHYTEKPGPSGIDDVVLNQLTAWQIQDPTVGYELAHRAYKWEEGSPQYEYGTYSLAVSRHVSFHIAKFFLPLLVIVLLSFAVFWIDPEDLSSSLAVGVTCLLAAVALQFTEEGSLPDVNYLTISDRAFTICYVIIGLSVLEAVWANRLVRSGNKEAALKLDHRCRFLFPAGLVVSVALSVLRAFTQG
jgi:hypothetical protein